MEKAILKTLTYADIFGYPLKAYEIHKWLISKKASLREVEIVLNRMSNKSNIKTQSGYLFLAGRKGLVGKRISRTKQSNQFYKKAKRAASALKINPWIKLVGVSGSLSMDNCDSSDDIDLILITSRKRLWLGRLLTIFILDLLGVRRKRDLKKFKDKICVNLLLEEDNLTQKNKDIYTAHEVLQMKVLWERGSTYIKYLEENSWAFKFLPNWTTAQGPAAPAFHRASSLSLRASRRKPSSAPPLAKLMDVLEDLSKALQLRYMGQPQGKERIETGALYFHPVDYRDKILKLYNSRVSNS